MAPARVAWNQGVQKRVSVTSSMLTQIKGIKMMGLTDHFSSIVQKLRVIELKLSIKFRVLVTILSVLSKQTPLAYHQPLMYQAC